MTLQYLHYDVFTAEPLTGNQLAVFTDARGLSTEMMQALAREMNFAESTFVLPAEQAGTNVRVRIFTPAVEMPMAGHPTIGTTFALADTGAIAAGTARVVLGLNIGPIPVDLEWGADRLRFAWMTQPNPEIGPVADDRAAVAAALGLGPGDLAPDLPIQRISCGVPYLIVPLRDSAAVDRAISDAAAHRRLRPSIGMDLPIFLFALSPESDHTVYSRMFAPGLGVPEDPATGSASGPLGCYLVHHGLVAGDAALRIVSLQGVAMARPSRIHIAVSGSRGAIVQVRVGGEAVLVARGELLV
jgi:trans-2,3-dihydro-3-hydroxyanthranilate isomerase